MLIRFQPSRVRAFTVVELLVVVAIISVLIAMLIPGVSRAKEVARRAMCLSSLQQWGRAHTAYATDNRGSYVIIGQAETPSSPQWYIGYVTTERRNLMAPYFGLPPVTQPLATAPAAVLAALPFMGVPDRFKGFPACPSALDFGGSAQVLWASSWGWTGVWAQHMNAPTSITNVAPVWTSPTTMNGLTQLRLVSCLVVQYPTNIAAYKPGSMALHGPRGRASGPNGAAPAAYNCEGTNSVFVDGSAKWTPVKDMAGYNMDSAWSHVTPVPSYFRAWW